jgi:membrane protein
MSASSPVAALGTEPDRRGPMRLIRRTAVTAWNDGVLGMAAQAAFWMTLSMPPLLLGLIGSLGFVAGWLGPVPVAAAEQEIVRLSSTAFTTDVVDRIIRPTVNGILAKGQGSLVSVGFVLSFWAGSTALASLVDSITEAYRQHTVRNPVWQRIFALLLYVAALMASVVMLPLAALGPGLLLGLVDDSARPALATVVGLLYYPVIGLLLTVGLATLYKIALPDKLPWHRGLPGALLAVVVFLVSSTGLRLYIAWVTSTGYTYGALATPIAMLLGAFFIGLAVVLGAQFNNGIEELWPADGR